jgi:hypothetical protein
MHTGGQRRAIMSTPPARARSPAFGAIMEARDHGLGRDTLEDRDAASLKARALVYPRALAR